MKIAARREENSRGSRGYVFKNDLQESKVLWGNCLSVSFILSRFRSEQSLSLCVSWTHQVSDSRDADEFIKSLTRYFFLVLVVWLRRSGGQAVWVGESERHARPQQTETLQDHQSVSSSSDSVRFIVYHIGSLQLGFYCTRCVWGDRWFSKQTFWPLVAGRAQVQLTEGRSVFSLLFCTLKMLHEELRFGILLWISNL